MILDHVTGMDAATDDHGVRCARFAQGKLGLDDYAIHRSYARRRTRNRNPPCRALNTIENTKRDERIEFVKAFERQDGDVHGRALMCHWAMNKSTSFPKA